MDSLPRRNRPDPAVGSYFGRWRVLIGRTPPREQGARSYVCYCRCSCGTERWISVNDLTRNGRRATRSCGCLQKERAGATNRTHALSKSRIYNTWRHMKMRCTNPADTRYSDYGGRGILLCPEWKTFIPFLNWSVDNGYGSTLQIDRIDVNGPYSPDNCRWSTTSQQMRNTRRNVRITVFGETKLAVEWLEDSRCTVKRATLRQRLHTGWDPALAVSTPLIPGGKRPTT